MRPLFLIAAVCVVPSLVACPARTPETADPPDSSSSDLIGGFDAAGSSLNAVGTVGFLDQDGHFQFLCTATLIGPSTVLTARHCGADPSQIRFAIGPDAKAPLQLYSVVDFQTAPLREGGVMALGSDVAVYQLATPVTGVKVFSLAPRPLADSDVSAKFVSIGFGLQSNVDGVFGPPNSTRKAGAATLQALHGKFFEIMFGSQDAYLQFVTTELGAAYVAEHRDELIAYYNELVLLDGFEAFVGNASGDSQTCFGDSGSPLLRKGASGQIEISGVVSGGIGSQELVCDKGGIYAIFGDSTRAFLDQSLAWKDPCAGLSVAGQCDGSVAMRCSGPDEGPRRKLEVDCAELGQTCGLNASGEAACLDVESD